MRQVITITPSGGVFGLQHKRGQGISLRSLGKVGIQRATLIEYDEDHQAWFIRWAEETRRWTEGTFFEASVNPYALKGRVGLIGALNDVVLFDDYEDAVAAEVAVIQSLQLSGSMTTHRS